MPDETQAQRTRAQALANASAKATAEADARAFARAIIDPRRVTWIPGDGPERPTVPDWSKRQ